MADRRGAASSRATRGHRLAFDVTTSITGVTGTARYALELSAALEAMPERPLVRRFAIGRGVRPAPAGTRHLRVPLRVVGRIWEWTGRPYVETITGPVDSVHATGPVIPPSKVPIVAVVHDLAPLEHPSMHPPRATETMRRFLGALDRASAIIAISEATAESLRGAGVPGEAIRVIPNGRNLLPPADEGMLGRPYVLAVGAPVPRKRLDVLVRAVAAVDGMDLAIVGPPDSEDERIADLARSLGMASRLHRAGPVTDAELARWYAGASVVAAPGVGEGFGLTVVEALASGVPVAASDIPAHREVTGGGALLVPPGDADALAEAITRAAARDADVVALTARGARHVERYTWPACAAATLALHREVAGR